MLQQPTHDSLASYTPYRDDPADGHLSGELVFADAGHMLCETHKGECDFAQTGAQATTLPILSFL